MRGSGVCLVTGGAGFIGSALSPDLVERFRNVVAVDILHPQVHATLSRPAALHPNVDLVVGDVTDINVWLDILRHVRPQVVVHLAAETGTGQSLTEARRHAHVNVTGITTMLDAFVQVMHVPDQFLLASSRAVYGEGAWRPVGGGAPIYPGPRSRGQLARREWDFLGLEVVGMGAAMQPHPISVYGATKLAQEHVLRSWALAFGSQVKIVRLQNVYGPGQSLSNSYTGIAALFCQIARRRNVISLYEDGLMLRDFILIDDVVDAILKAMDCPDASGKVLDVGTGRARTIADLARIIAQHYGAPPPIVSSQYRFGDVRHAVCDVQPTVDLLGWSPRYELEDGVERLTTWIEQVLPAANNNCK